ncbi:MAG: carbon-nitrogen hydrolase family protein [Deltaproteobacteria bacterium]|nr:carbon-nitrogen hydrolase family protein [Deltaproteobacteria bacterium]
MRSFRAAAVQLHSTADMARNLERAEHWVRRAKESGATLVALPENFAWIRVPGAGEPPSGGLDGEIVSRMRALARDCGCYLLLGGFPEAVPGELRVYNSSALIDPAGELLAVYRKRHLFDVDLPEGPCIRESDFNLPGDEIVCADTPLGRIGLAICYDLRFCEHFRALVDLGAELLCAPAAFTAPTGRAHWHVLIRARAIENQCFAVAPGQAGFHGGDRHSYGHSLIVDPWGEILAELDSERDEGLAVADLDAVRLEQVRRILPALRHRR